MLRSFFCGVAVLWIGMVAAPAVAQTTLAAGDIAIIGYNFDDPDEFAFVTLIDLEAGTAINFTDNGWTAGGAFRTGEGTLNWVAPAAYSAGDIINPGVGSMQFSVSGDQILAYQGDSSSPTFIYAIHSNDIGWNADATSSNESALPTGLVNGTSAVAIPEIDNAVYSGSGTATNQAELLSWIGDITNWTTDNTNRLTMPSGSFTVPVELMSLSVE